MQIAEAMEVLRRDRDLCMFNPATGERQPISEGCRLSAEAYDTILNEWDGLKKRWNECMDLARQANIVIDAWNKAECKIEEMAQAQTEIISIIRECRKEAFSANG